MTGIKLRSLLFWGAWILVGAVYELWAVLMEHRTGDQPLTRLMRDRLMRVPLWGKILQFAVMGFLAWWLVHWGANLPW